MVTLAAALFAQILQAPTLDLFINPLRFAGFAMWWISTLYCVSICQRHSNIPGEMRRWYNLLVLITGPWGLLVVLSRYHRPRTTGTAGSSSRFGEWGSLGGWFSTWFSAGPSLPVGEREIELCTADGKPLDEIDAHYGHKGRREDSEALNHIKKVLYDAVNIGATDVLIDPRSKNLYSIRFRIDGILEEAEQTEGKLASNMLNCLKIASHMDIAERRRPQDGSFVVKMRDLQISCRMATAGTLRGAKAAIRILDRRVGLKSLTELGLRQQDLDRLHAAVERKTGMILVCGPTGGGKTTTLYAVLKHFDPYSRNLVTVEDPIEYPLEHATQSEVNPKAQITFANALRSILRQNPDVILVGEVRDAETADLALQAANTGHLVLTTVHGNDSAGAILRLRDLGMPPERLAGAVTAVLSQRLIRRLCRHCARPAKLSGEDRKMMKKYNVRSGTILESVGCEHCRQTGFSGREGLFELLFVDRQVNEALMLNPSMEDLRRAAVDAGMIPMFQHGLEKVTAGLTSLAEVRQVCEP